MMSSFYSKSEVQAIQKSYRYLFPVIDKKLDEFWYPPHDFDWHCLSTRFHPGPTYESFLALDDDLKTINRALEPKIIGCEVARLAQKYGVGYSVGLNPWADYLMLLASQAHMLQEIVIVVAHNWYPLVTTNEKEGNKPPNSPLYKDDPCTFNHKKYAPAFEPFLNRGRPLRVFFTNIFPYFTEAGKSTEGKLSSFQRKFVGGDKGMRIGLIRTLEAINPSVQIRGLVILGGDAISALDESRFSGMKLADIVLSLQAKLRDGVSNVRKTLPTLPVNGGFVPWLPYFHPAAHVKANVWKDYPNLVQALL